MRPVWRSLLAELSPGWLAAARLRNRKGLTAASEREVEAAQAVRDAEPVATARKTQAACYAPPRRSSDDVASNM